MAEDTSKNQGQASDKTHEKIDQAVERVKKEAGSAADATKHKADQAEQRVDKATDATARSAHRAADKAADWRQRGGAAVDDMRGRAEDWYECACDYVREKPVQSVAIALATGWLIGRIMGWRR
ncbi:MAG: DUF883 family protein [Rhodanobacteraceae bacterium]